MQRRTLLKTLATLPLWPTPASQAAAPAAPKLYSCVNHANHPYLSAVTERGEPLFQQPLPGRGHAVLLHPYQPLVAVVARRPQSWLALFESHSGTPLATIQAPKGYHFYGHGLFTATGELLLTANEFDHPEGRGVIIRYDNQLNPLSEWPSGGIGPHELKPLPDSTTLAVANGGIQTHPDYGRTKLNLATMRPNVALIDLSDGRLLHRFEPPEHWHQLSMRHLDVTGDTIVVAMQYQGAANQNPPLLGVIETLQQRIDFLSAPAKIEPQLRNYIGSIRCSHDGQLIALSAPRGNRIVLWSLAERRYLTSLTVNDGCGITAIDSRDFLFSSGDGELLYYQSQPQQLTPLISAAESQRRWDNHLTLSGV
ncbi:DUF1513 domain-containing protein [Ectothiorhodospiraceae bacterium BW-2]|nr:DUF1513 domain-containing protein [Ectothiorhodospiraceae bacterium BW-2]